MKMVVAGAAGFIGAVDDLTDGPKYRNPLNVYGYSKLLFDNIVRYVGWLSAHVTD